MRSGSSLIMMVQAAKAASGQEGEHRPFGGLFDPDAEIVNDFAADVIIEVHSPRALSLRAPEGMPPNKPVKLLASEPSALGHGLPAMR